MSGKLDTNLVIDILDIYLGKYANLFVFLGTSKNPVKIMLGNPIIGIIKEQENIFLFVDEIQQTIVNIADPSGVLLVQAKLDSIFSQYYLNLDLMAESQRVRLITESLDCGI